MAITAVMSPGDFERLHAHASPSGLAFAVRSGVLELGLADVPEALRRLRSAGGVRRLRSAGGVDEPAVVAFEVMHPDRYPGHA